MSDLLRSEFFCNVNFPPNFNHSFFMLITWGSLSSDDESFKIHFQLVDLLQSANSSNHDIVINIEESIKKIDNDDMKST